MINKKTIFSVFLILLLICKYEISYGIEFNPEIYKGISNYFFVEKVVKDSPAYNAGIKAQDRIVELENEKRMLSADDAAFFFKKFKSKTINVKVFRKNKIINLKVPPYTNSFGALISPRCTRNRDLNYYEDLTARECRYKIELDQYNYLKKLEKTSPYFETYIKDKILNSKRIARDFLSIPSIFNFEKGIKIYTDALDLSQENINIIKKKYQTRVWRMIIKDIEPGTLAYELGKIYFNEYRIFDNVQPDISNYTDYKKGFKFMLIASNENHSKASYELGKKYLNTHSEIEKNEKKAFKFIKKSTQLGNTKAHKDLAYFYLLGLGGKKKNYSKALVHFKLGSVRKFNMSENYYNIYLLHEYKKLPKNSDEYYNWLSKDLANIKGITNFENIGNFSKLFLNNYSDAYKWYFICSSNLNLNEVTVGRWIVNSKQYCKREMSNLELTFLTGKEIISAKKDAKKWLRKNNMVDEIPQEDIKR